MLGRVLATAAVMAVMLAALAPAQAQVSDDVVKIGVLTDMNGPASTPTGPGSMAAAQMAVARKLGRDLLGA